jgi:hypothetical protein
MYRPLGPQGGALRAPGPPSPEGLRALYLSACDYLQKYLTGTLFLMFWLLWAHSIVLLCSCLKAVFLKKHQH